MMSRVVQEMEKGIKAQLVRVQGLAHFADTSSQVLVLEQEKLSEAQIDRILGKLFATPAVNPVLAQSPDDDEEDKVMRQVDNRRNNRQSGLFGY
jgi:hypothetical protein